MINQRMLSNRTRAFARMCLAPKARDYSSLGQRPGVAPGWFDNAPLALISYLSAEPAASILESAFPHVGQACSSGHATNLAAQICRLNLRSLLEAQYSGRCRCGTVATDG